MTGLPEAVRKSLSLPADSRLLLIASTGGHLAQLVKLMSAVPHSHDSLWMTFRTPQSEALLAGRRVQYVPYVRPRDWRGVLGFLRHVNQTLKGESFDVAISTGAGPASALALTRLKGIRSVYIESVSRIEGPSLTGRALALSRLTELRSQHSGWARGRWACEFSVLSGYQVRQQAKPVDADALRIFVTLGTIQPYQFPAAVEAVRRVLSPSDHVEWQLGCTATDASLPGNVRQQVSSEDFRRLAQGSDVVISHAGVGTAMDLLDLGIYPVLLARRSSRREHVDDHQAQIASLLALRGLAASPEVEALTRQDLVTAAQAVVIP